MGISEKIQRIIKKILKYISRMFSKTPKRKFYFGMFYKHCKVKDNVILVESFHGSNISDSTLALVRQILKSYPGKYKIYYGTENKKKHAEFIKEIGLDVKLIDVSTFKYTKILASAKYLINNSSFPVILLKSRSRFIFKLGTALRLKRSAKKCASALSQCIMFSIIFCRLTI